MDQVRSKSHLIRFKKKLDKKRTALGPRRYPIYLALEALFHLQQSICHADQNNIDYWIADLHRNMLTAFEAAQP